MGRSRVSAIVSEIVTGIVVASLIGLGNVDAIALACLRNLDWSWNCSVVIGIVDAIGIGFLFVILTASLTVFIIEFLSGFGIVNVIVIECF